MPLAIQDETRLPPGPPLPRLLQTFAFVFRGARFLDNCQRRYGGVVTFGTLFDRMFVMVFDPELVRELFQGPAEQLHAGEANVMLGPIVGERSVLLLDGAEHLRHRRLLLPSFHGARMGAWRQTMLEATDREIDSWPVGETFSLLPRMHHLTLSVIVRAVFGFEPGETERELRRRVRALIDPLSHARGMAAVAAISRGRGDRRAARQHEARKAALDELLYAEIARRRSEPDLHEREDIFSTLLVSLDEHGLRLSDREIRDELLTLLLAGHETTATGLAWTFDLLLHNPEVLERARSAGDEYLDAVVKESLRIRPVIPGVGRVVRGEPFRLGGYEVPVGVEINPSIRTIHRRADLYPDPERFLPERFLSDDPPDTYTWLPFGGGTRRCLGASFALAEMRIVVRRVLERAELEPVDARLAKPQLRAITLGPKGGVRVRLASPPRPGVDTASGSALEEPQRSPAA